MAQWASEHPDIAIDDELKFTQAVLCMPIINGQKNVIGVVQFLNKVNIKSTQSILYRIKLWLMLICFVLICFDLF